MKLLCILFAKCLYLLLINCYRNLALSCRQVYPSSSRRIWGLHALELSRQPLVTMKAMSLEKTSGVFFSSSVKPLLDCFTQ